MDPKAIDRLEGALSAAYRAAFKLRSLQRLCQMDVVHMHSLSSTLQAVGAGGKATEADVGACLQRLLSDVSQNAVLQTTPAAVKHTTRLLFKLFDREQSGFVLLRSVEAVLIALSGDTLSAKHTALFQLARSCSEDQDRHSGTVSQSSLRVLLEDLSQVPVVVQESHMFGQVDRAVASCFQGILDGGVPEKHFLCWLRSEPRLLLWLSTLSRVSASESLVHQVRCHLCKAFPIIGLRYRCLKCLDLQLCQTCFLAQRATRKHKPFHAVLEYCTQPSLRESLAMLAHLMRQKVRRRHASRREAETMGALCSAETINGARLSSSTPVLTQDVGADHKTHVETVPSQTTVESKAMQTDTYPQPQEKILLFKQDLYQTQMALRDLHKEKWQLQKQFQAWISSAQSEHNLLKDRCCQMEAAVEVLTQHNQNLQEELFRVQQMLAGKKKTEEEDTHVPETESLKQDNVVYNYSQRELKVSSASFQEEGGAQTDYQTSGQSIVKPTALKNSKGSGWHPLNEKQESDQCQDSILQQESNIGRGKQSDSNSFVEQEAQLFDLVQWLKSSLSLSQQRGSVCTPQEDLLVAAEGVRRSISQLVTTVSLHKPASSQTL